MISTVIQYSTLDFRFIDKNLQQVNKFCDDIIVTICEKFFNGEIENQNIIDQTLEIINKYPNVKTKIIPWYGIPDHFSYYHNMSRMTGANMCKYDWILFLDSDEIVSDEFGNWFDVNKYTDKTYAFNCYWYFREPTYQSKTKECAGLLMRRDHLNGWDVFNKLELKQFYQKLYDSGRLAHGDLSPVLSLTNQPLIHHFSWVRTREQMLKKVQNWGHSHDKDWTQLVVEEFSRPFNGTDFVHNYEYNIVDNIFNL